ncbi:MAG TPA: TetR/AcrR family transcriptional regulator C-terminal domain-containing protein [Trebonia sp.]|nr:TetR/AcrR family transcriptional regulator C-terminal domain-containing protein [Trebonia sp.]
MRSKGELLAAIADEIMREVYDIEAARGEDADDSADWTEQTTAFAHRLRRALLAHRDGARVVIGHLSLSGTAVEVAEQGLATMRAAGFALDRAAYFGDTITSYVTGFVLQEQAVASAVPSAVPSAAATAVLMEIEPTRYPNLREWQECRPASRDQAFAAGLTIIVNACGRPDRLFEGRCTGRVPGPRTALGPARVLHPRQPRGRGGTPLIWCVLPAALSWCSVQPRLAVSSGRVSAVKISAARR